MTATARIAVRTLARRPVLTATVVLTLTVSIAAATAIFAVVDAVVIRPLPYPGAERLVAVLERDTRQRQTSGLAAGVRLDEWHRLTHAFDAIAGSYFENMTDTTGDLPERVAAMRTSPQFFDVLRTKAALGRTFTRDEERFGGPGAVVLSDALWRARFGADSRILGRTLTLAGAQRVVIGVMPPSFRYPTAATEAWVPAQMPERLATDRRASFYTGVGRLKPGVSIAQAQQELVAAQRRLSGEFPQTDAWTQPALTPLKDQLLGNMRSTLWLLLGATLVMLLAACGNVAGLLMADARRRDAQVRVQLALGAPRHVVVRQRLLEGACLAGGGAAGGLLLAFWGLEAIRANAVRLPRAGEVAIDLRVALFTIAVSAFVTLLCAWLPALSATRDRGLRLETRGEIGSHAAQRFLVAGQVALAVLLLVGAGLLVRSQRQVNHTATGYTADGVIAFRMTAAWSERPDAVANRQQRTLDRLRATPGIVDAALTGTLPSGPDADAPPTAFTIVGRDDDGERAAVVRLASRRYFSTLGISMTQGDTCRDEPQVPPRTTYVVNQTFAGTFFPSERALGHYLVQRTTGEIVGVAADARDRSVLQPPVPTIYVCGLAPYYPDPWYVVRLDPAHPASVATIRAAMREIEPLRAVYDPRPLDAVLAEATAQTRMNTFLFGFFAVTTTVLVAVGLYGLLMQFVTDRTREIGVRLALGARPGQAIAHVVAQSLRVSGLGLVVGLIAAAVLTRAMAAVLYGISPHDPLTFVVVAAALIVLVLGVTSLPARKAAHLDPTVTLRHD